MPTTEISLNVAEERGIRWGVLSIIAPLLGGVLFYQFGQIFPVRDKTDDSFLPVLGILLLLLSAITGLVSAFVSRAHHERYRAVSVVGLLINALVLSYFLLVPLYHLSITEENVLAISLVVSLYAHILIPRFTLACLVTVFMSPWLFALEEYTRPTPKPADISWLPFLLFSALYALGITLVIGLPFYLFRRWRRESAKRNSLSPASHVSG